MPSVLELKNRSLGAIPLVTVTQDDSILDVLKLLVDYAILSCPVVDSQGHCVDIVDKLDIVTYTLQDPSFEAGADHTPNPALTKPITAVLDARDHKRRNTFRPLLATSTVSDVVKELVNMQRVPLLDESGQVAGVITQSDLIQIAHDNTAALGPIIHQTVKSLRVTAGIARAPLITCSRDTSIGEAILTLSRNNIQGMPVVDQFGKFLGNFSTSQLKRSGVCNFNKLSPEVYKVPVGDQLDRAGTLPTTVDESCTLETVLQRLVQSGNHRVYVLSPDSVPLHVISMSDALMALSGSLHTLE